jgi:putative ABC transport system substrate-binding protein
MRRREFIIGIGSTSALPLVARAQQSDPLRRVGVLMGAAEADPISPLRITALKHKLQELGWIEGHNLRLDVFWAAGNVDRMRAGAKEMVGLRPDAIVVHTLAPALALQKETHTIPIVFTVVSNPDGAGLVDSLTRPSGNMTGFTNMEPTMGAKWLQLLKEIAPRVKRVAIMFNPDAAPVVMPFSLSAEAAAHAIGVETVAIPIHQPADIAEALTKLGHEPGGGLMLLPDIFVATHRAISTGGRRSGFFTAEKLAPGNLGLLGESQFLAWFLVRRSRCDDASSSRCLAARRHGRSWHARSNRSGCGAWAH